MNNTTSENGNSVPLEQTNQLKEELQNDSASVMTGNDDMDVNDENENMEDESSSDDEEQFDSNLRDYTAFRQLQKEKDNVLYLLEIGMSFIESLTKATKENINPEDAKEDCKNHISNYYETLSTMKTNLARHIYMSSMNSPLNFEGSLYTERKKIEIENKKAKLLSLETSKPKSGIFTDDFSSVNTFNNNNLDNISQSNISYSNTTSTPNK